MSIEIFHLAANNCKTQVVLELDFTGDTEINGKIIHNANVLSIFASTDDDRIIKAIIVACSLSCTHESDTIRIGWDFDEQVRPLLNLAKDTPAKCCHLINYLAKQYGFNLNF